MFDKVIFLLDKADPFLQPAWLQNHPVTSHVVRYAFDSPTTDW